jgi:hypothetical protein
MENIKTTETEELFNKYDEVINIIMVNLYTLSKDDKKIVLSGLDRKNRDHLLILRVALMAKDIYNYPLSLKIGFWDSLILNWKMRKLSRRVPREKKLDNEISIPELLEFMYPPVREYIGEDFKFSNIYNAFYRKELD